MTAKASGHKAKEHQREKYKSLREALWPRLALLLPECSRPWLSPALYPPREAPYLLTQSISSSVDKGMGQAELPLW